MFDFRKELEHFPETFGIYIMKNKAGDIIYVGKANNLKSRVFQYFNGQDKRMKIDTLRNQIEKIEHIITNSEIEALILENNLIKQNKPKYNTLLKDDKTYPYIEVTVKEKYPRILISSEIKNNGSKYFGPFPDKKALKNIINILQKIYKIRTCNFFNKKGCLYYSMNLCSAPCLGEISEDEYKKNINECVKILSGENVEIISDFTKKMYEASDNLEFEKAQEYKTIIEDFKYIASKQRINSSKDVNEDIIICRKNEYCVIIVIFEIRNGKIIGNKRFFVNDFLDNNISDIIASFIKQYYLNLVYVPKNIILEENLNEKDNIINYLFALKNEKVNIIVPKKGDKKKQLSLAVQNAEIILMEEKNKIENKIKKETEGLNNLEKIIGVKLSRIESFDISHLGGTGNVASMVVLENGKFNRKLFRKFRLKTEGNNDILHMQEVIERRFTDRNLLETSPDALFIDGGEEQVNCVLGILNKLGFNIPVVGMVKDNKHNTRGLILNGKEIELNKKSSEFKLLTNIQDETHNFAINYQKNVRNKIMFASIFDDIKGLGEVKKKALFEKFGTLENIKNATIEELCSVKGITEDMAKKIKEKSLPNYS